MSPIIGPRLLWLMMFRIEAATEIAVALSTPLMAVRFDEEGIRSNSNRLVSLRLKSTEPGPRPKFREIVSSPGLGFGSINPYFVWIGPGHSAWAEEVLQQLAGAITLARLKGPDWLSLKVFRLTEVNCRSQWGYHLRGTPHGSRAYSDYPDVEVTKGTASPRDTKVNARARAHK